LTEITTLPLVGDERKSCHNSESALKEEPISFYLFNEKLSKPAARQCVGTQTTKI